MALAAHLVHLEFVVRFHLTDDLYSVTEWVGGVHAYFDPSQSDGIEVAPGLLAVWVDFVLTGAVDRSKTLGLCAQRLSAEDRSVALMGVAGVVAFDVGHVVGSS